MGVSISNKGTRGEFEIQRSARRRGCLHGGLDCGMNEEGGEIRRGMQGKKKDRVVFVMGVTVPLVALNKKEKTG